MTENIEILLDWVTARMIRVQYIFTKVDVPAVISPLSNDALINSLVRINLGPIMTISFRLGEVFGQMSDKRGRPYLTLMF